jgi:uncharacterized protein
MRTKENILELLKANKSKLAELGISDVGLFGSFVRNEQSN